MSIKLTNIKDVPTAKATKAKPEEEGGDVEYDKDGRIKVTINDDKKIRFWIICCAGAAGGQDAIAKALYENIRDDKELMAFVQLQGEFVTTLSNIIDAVCTVENNNAVSDKEFVGFVDHLLSMGQAHFDALIANNGAELLNKDDRMYYDRNGKPISASFDVQKAVQRHINYIQKKER